MIVRCWKWRLRLQELLDFGMSEGNASMLRIALGFRIYGGGLSKMTAMRFDWRQA